MKVWAAVISSASGLLLRSSTNPGEWQKTCAGMGGLVTPWYDTESAGETVPVFCVTASVCKGHLGREKESSTLPVTVFNRSTKLREEQKSCSEKDGLAEQCCTDVLNTRQLGGCSAGGSAPCKLGDVAKMGDYASWTEVFEQGGDAFKDDCTNKAPTATAGSTIAAQDPTP